MKRTHLSLALWLFAAPVLQAQAPASQSKASGPQEPVFIYLYSTVTDQVNLDITEDRLRHLLPMIERLRSAHPQAHVSATILFSGAVSQALEERNAKTHIKDYILDYKKRGAIEVGYDGTDEPTYEHRPLVQLAEGSTPDQRWLARESVDEKFLTEARDPVTGAVLPGSVGGLEEMQRVFGEAACIRGVSANESVKPMPHSPPLPRSLADQPPGTNPATASAAKPIPPPDPPTAVSYLDLRPEVGDWEIVPVLRRYNTKAILFGIPESNPYDIAGYKGAAWGIGQLASPAPNTSPELYWANNILHTSEWSGGSVAPIVRTIHGYETLDALKEFAAKMIDRSRVQIVHMDLASEKDYLKDDFVKTWSSPTSYAPSLAYAYAHPDSPKVPAEARLSAAEVNAAYAREDAALKWLAEDYFAANPGSHFIASSDFERMTPPSNGYSISVAALTTALRDVLAKWGNDTFPPNYVLADGHYLSEAEVFQVMTDALAEFDRTGKLPQSVKVVRVYGPMWIQQGHGPNVGELSVASIAKECSEIAPRLHDETADPVPHNAIPSGVKVEDTVLNSAQFLRLMAEAMVNPSREAKLRVKMTYMFTGATEMYPRTRNIVDTGATWTFKPAPLEVGLLSSPASR
jgi:hypothetical protein